MNRQRSTALAGDEGFALLWLAVILVALLLVSGLALDGGRAYLVKMQLSKAVDGAALAAARMLNSADPRAEAEAVFKANFPTGFMGTNGSDPTAAGDFYRLTTDEASGVNRVEINASMLMPTSFMALGDVLSVDIGSSAEATRRMVDLCLVLDTSGSLGWRYPYVRDAARAFVAAFDEASDRFCLVRYSSGAEVLEPMTAARGFDKRGIIDAIPETIPSDGYTSMAEGLWHGWDELRTVPNGQQSSLRIIVLFTDGAANGVPGLWDNAPATARSLNTSDFPENAPDPDNITSNTPSYRGMFDTWSGARSPSVSGSFTWNSTSTVPGLPLMPAASYHAHGRSSGITTSFPLQSDTLTVNGVPQSTARGLRHPAGGRYPTQIWNINNAARNLVEIIADAARGDTSGDYRIRIYTIGMGELIRYLVGTIPEYPEDIMLRVANDIDSQDFNETHVEGKYYYAATEADVGVAFQELQNEIIRLSK
jgi:Flp pilus assembly protein TadG